MTPHVLVIGGGQNAEHDISLKTAAAIEGALRRRGFETSTITIDRDGRWRQGAEPLGEKARPLAVLGLGKLVGQVLEQSLDVAGAEQRRHFAYENRRGAERLDHEAKPLKLGGGS